MSAHANPDIIDDGLVFLYDTDDGKSYKGEPTTNVVADPLPTTGWGVSNYLTSTATRTYSSENGIPHMEISNVNVDGSYPRINMASLTSTITDGFSISFEAKSNLSNAQLYFALYSSGSTKTSQLATLSTEWQRFEFENLTTGYTLDAGYLRFPSSGDSGTVYYIRRMQVEQKTHATPFVDGTRSSTQGLLDRTGNTTIDISNASFDSNAQMTFDGTDDYADVSATDLFQPQNTTDGFTVEYVYRPEANTSVVPVGNLDSTNGWFQAPISNGSLGAYLYFSTDGVVLSTDSSYAINSGIIGKYQHIVMVLKWSDTANSFIMVNGEDKTASKATASKYTVSGSANPALRIGKRGGSIWPANGQMPLIKIYNRALTAAEVLQNFNATKSRFGL